MLWGPSSSSDRKNEARVLGISRITYHGLQHPRACLCFRRWSARVRLYMGEHILGEWVPTCATRIVSDGAGTRPG